MQHIVRIRESLGMASHELLASQAQQLPFIHWPFTIAEWLFIHTIIRTPHDYQLITNGVACRPPKACTRLDGSITHASIDG